MPSTLSQSYVKLARKPKKQVEPDPEDDDTFSLAGLGEDIPEPPPKPRVESAYRGLVPKPNPPSMSAPKKSKSKPLPPPPKSEPAPSLPEDTEGQYEHTHPNPEVAYKKIDEAPAQPQAPSVEQLDEHGPHDFDILGSYEGGGILRGIEEQGGDLTHGMAGMLGDYLQDYAPGSIGSIVGDAIHNGRAIANPNPETFNAHSIPLGHARMDVLRDSEGNPLTNDRGEPLAHMVHIHYPQGRVTTYYRMNP